MNTFNEELLSLVRQVTPTASDPARAAVADWMYARPYQRSGLDSIPMGESTHIALQRWYRRTVLPRHRRKNRVRIERGRWTSQDIHNSYLSDLGVGILFGGYGRIAGCRVIGTSPLWKTEEEAKEAAASLHDTLGTAVTYVRPRSENSLYRLVVWYGLRGRELPLPPDRTGPLTEQFIREHFKEDADGEIPAFDAHWRYDRWMEKQDCESLPRPQFAREVARIFPKARTMRRKTMVGIAWINPKIGVALSPLS